MLERIKQNPRLKHFVIGLISSHKNPRPRLWVRWLVNPFVHKRGRGAVVRRWRSRHDLFPWHRFEVGKGALIEQFTVLNNGAGDILIGDGARVGIGSVVIGPVKMGDRAGLGQHVFIAGFNHGYADPTRDSNEQPLAVREVVIGRESHIGANAVIVAGVHIGERVQIGAGSVVTKDIPSYSVAAGNPARVIKRYDFRRRRWIRVDEQATDAGRANGKGNAEQREKETRREDEPTARAHPSGQSGPGRRSGRQENPYQKAGGNTPSANESPRGVSTDRRAKPTDRAAAEGAGSNADRQTRNRAQQPAPPSEQAHTMPVQPLAGQRQDPSLSGNAQDETTPSARRRRNRRKSAPNGAERNTPTGEAVETGTEHALGGNSARAVGPQHGKRVDRKGDDTNVTRASPVDARPQESAESGQIPDDRSEHSHEQ